MEFIISIFDFIFAFSQFIMPFFIFVLIFNAGMSEHPKTIWETMNKNKAFYFKLMLYANIFIPVVVSLALNFTGLADAYKNGIIILFTTAGASTVIVFMQQANEKVSYAVTSMILLTLVTVMVSPILLPIFIHGVTINPLNLLGDMVTSILIPLLLGMSIQTFFSNFVSKIRPISLFLQKQFMMVAIYGTLLGLTPDLIGLIGTGVISIGVAITILAFLGGYVIQTQNASNAMKYTSAFVGGQRNGAVAFSIALTNFSDSDLILTIGIVTSLSTIIFTYIANYLHNKQSVEVANGNNINIQ